MEVKLYNATGSIETSSLTYDNVRKFQYEMFYRTIQNAAPTQVASDAQEHRQLLVVDKLVKIEVLVAREDFPLTRGKILVEYDPSAYQQAWEKFLTDVSKFLNIEFIETILERGDKAPVFRIQRLKDGGDYLVRQRETSAVLEVLNSNKTPMEISWPITNHIVELKDDLRFQISNLSDLTDRVKDLVSRPLNTKSEREIYKQIQDVKHPDTLITIVNSLYIDETNTEPRSKETNIITLNTNYNNISKYENKFDIINIHRVVIEKLNRMALVKEGVKSVVKFGLPYIMKMVRDLIYEPDIVILGLKFLNDIIMNILKQRENIFALILDVIQHYAPPSPAHRPRKPRRKNKKKKLTDILDNLEDDDNDEEKQTSTENNNDEPPEIVDYGFGNEPVKFSAKQQMLMESSSNPLHKFNPKNKTSDSFMKISNPYPDPPKDLMKLTRYKEDHVLDEFRTKHKQYTNDILNYAKYIEIDDNLVAITPRTKQRKKDEEEERKVKAREEKERKLREEEEAKRKANEILTEPPKTLILGRNRINHKAAKEAIDKAAASAEKGNAIKLAAEKQSSASNNLIPVNPPTRPIKPSSESNVAMPSILPSTNKLSEIKESNDDDTDEQSVNPFLPSSILKSKPKPQFIIKKKDKNSDKNKDEDIDNETSHSLRWKGSKGVIHKPPPAFRSATMRASALGDELKKLFSKENKGNLMSSTEDHLEVVRQSDTLKETSEPSEKLPPLVSAQPILPTPSEPTQPEPTNSSQINNPEPLPKAEPENSSNLPTDNSQSNNNQQNLSASWVPSMNQSKKKKKKLILTPLPEVSCPTFRGFGNLMQSSVALNQSFASLLKILTSNYGNRVYAFEHLVHEEIAEIVLVCPAMPRVLEYFVEIIETMYKEGFGDPLLMWEDQIPIEEENSMALSTNTFASIDHQRQNGPTTGFVFDTLSEVSMPSIDPDFPFHEIPPPVIEIQTEKGNEDKKEMIIQITSEDSIRSINAVADKLAKSNKIPSKEENAMDKKKTFGRQIRNQELVNQLGLIEYEARYVNIPPKEVIIALSMCIQHIEVGELQREKAGHWLDFWDDSSIEYRLWKKKGKDLCGL